MKRSGAARFENPGWAPSTSSMCSAYGSQSVARYSRPPGRSTRWTSAANPGWTSRRLWWRFFGHGSGNQTSTSSTLAGASRCSSTSSASAIATRTFPSPASWQRASRRPTPGG